MDVAINVWAVVVAGVATMAVGFAWYGPLLGRQWMKLTGLTKESVKSMSLSGQQAMAGGFVAALLTAYVLSWLSGALGVEGAGGALNMAFWSWLGFAVPLSSGAWLWEGKSFKLFALNAAHYLVSWSVMSLIVTLWK